MGKYSIPKEILALPRPIGTEVKKTNGNKYYVYEVSHKFVDGKRKKVSGKCIGTLSLSLGFVSNDNYLLISKTTSYEYGQYAFAFKYSASVLENLQQFFNKEDAYRIYIFALIQVVNSYTGISSIETYFNQSYLSALFPDLSFSYYKLSQLLDNLGRKQDASNKFQQFLLDESTEIAVDGHVIKTSSKKNSLANIGYKYSTINSAQMNLVMAYDTKKNTPVFARMFQGNKPDKTSFWELLSQYNYEHILFLIDRGFFSEDNLEVINYCDCQYIIPLSENLKDYKNITTNQNFNDEFMYEINDRYDLVQCKELKVTDKGYRVILYKNLTENNKERCSYYSKLKEGINGYTQQGYDKSKDWFGTIVLRTNCMDKSPNDIYCSYKRRWKIETYFNYLKNSYDFTDLQIEDYFKIQGLCFIMLISSLIHSELNKVAKTYNDYSLAKMLLQMRNIVMTKEQNRWKLQNINLKIYDITKTIGFDYIKDIVEIDKKLRIMSGT